MRNIRKIIKESIREMILESSRFSPDEQLNAGLVSLDEMSQQEKIAAQNEMGLDPLSYFYPFPTQIGSQWSAGMGFMGNDRTIRVVKMRDIGGGRKVPMKIKIQSRSDIDGLPLYDENGDPVEEEMVVKETIPIGGQTVFTGPFFKATFGIPVGNMEFTIYAMGPTIEYMKNLPLFRLREKEMIDKGLFLYSRYHSSNTPNHIFRPEVYGFGSLGEKVMSELGKWVGSVPQDYNHDAAVAKLKELRDIIEARERRKAEEKANSPEGQLRQYEERWAHLDPETRERRLAQVRRRLGL